MNKITKYILLSVVATMVVTSCDDYSAPTLTTDPAINIVSRETDFPAGASTGTIKFTADGPVTVSTSNSWISASVQGNEILVSCTENNSLDSRAGSIVAKCEGRTTEISIIQEGMFFQISAQGTISFGNTASSQKFDVKSNIPVTVSTNNDWISASLSDDVLTVSVQANPNLDPREGSFTVSYGSNENKINVSQTGFTLALFDVKEWKMTGASNTTLGTYTYPFDTFDFSTDCDWISYTISGGRLSITAAANTTKHPRSATMTFTVGTRTGQIPVSQCNFTTDMVGSGWGLYYYDPSKSGWYYVDAEIKGSGSSYTINLTNGLAIPFTYNSTSQILTLKGGQSCGVISSYYAYTTFFYGDYVTWAETATYDGSPVYEVEDGEAYTMVEFDDAGTYTEALESFVIYAFSSTTLSGDTALGYLYWMQFPFLMRDEVAPTGLTKSLSVKVPGSKNKVTVNAQPATGELTKSKFSFVK